MRHRTPIRTLPEQVRDRIAAGEVVERPASAVKELVENALDAGASTVRIEIEEGGIRRIRVTDDGCGIPRDELPTAVAPHATSKIRGLDDLDRIATYGFRGEALASIAAIAGLEITSRTTGSGGAFRIRVEEGRPRPVEPIAAGPGTTVSVEHLFRNFPARRKHMKSARTETGYVREWITRLALARPDVAIHAAGIGARPLVLTAGERRERTTALLGGEIDGHLLPVDRVEGEIRIEGLLGDATIHRGSARAIHLFVNNRWVRSRLLVHALMEGLHALIPPRRFPVATLFVTLPPDQVDVNVHPTKEEIRFLHGQTLHRLMRTACTEAITGVAPTAPVRAIPPAPAIRAAVVGGADPQAPTAPLSPDPLPFEPSASPRTAEPVQQEWRSEERIPRHLAVHDAYLVIETEEGLEIVDQHALHERVLYERFTRDLADRRIETQSLLVPEVVDLAPEELAAFEEIRPTIEELGFEVDTFGEGSVAVRAIPVEFRGTVAAFLQSLFDRTASGSAADVTRLREQVVRILACRSAVKAGERLPPEQVRALLTAGASARHGHACEHGRPTTIRLALADLERMFHRK